LHLLVDLTDSSFRLIASKQLARREHGGKVRLIQQALAWNFSQSSSGSSLSDWGGIEIEKDLNGLAKLSGAWQTIRELLAPGELLNNCCSSARP
jgi:hypothetical protein